MKPSPEALARYVVHPADGAVPVPWAEHFGRAAPLRVELGFGSGESLAWWAQESPDCDHVGIEKPPECLLRASRACANAGIGNVRLVQGDGRYLLRELFATGSVAELLMQFPMPWPKERHAKHRVTGPHFVATLADVLAPGGSFTLVTDQAWYADDAERLFAATDGFAIEERVVDAPRAFRTRYESKWLAEGRSIHTLCVRHASPLPAIRIQIPEAMLAIRFDVSPDGPLVGALAGRRFQRDDLVGEVKEVFANDDGWLLKVLSSDGSFSQLFFLRLVRRADGGATLKVEDHPRPYFTNAVRFLVESAGAALRGVAAAG